jgi:hypothetical protein
MSRYAALPVLLVMLGGDLACAQTTTPPPQNAPSPSNQAACPPDAGANSPTVGSGQSNPNLSDQLANSSGVICPPSGVDPEIHVSPPGGGRTPVIPPPGSPGGDPNVKPK